MSEKLRHKKDGEDAGKQNQSMDEYQKTGKLPEDGRTVSDAERLANTPRESFDADLRPHEHSGENSGLASEPSDRELRRAYDIKELHEMLPNFQSDDLKNLVVLAEGTRCEQGATYYDIKHPQDGVFKARADMVADAGNYLVPKSQIDFELWNKLIGRETAPDSE